jgi:hypothetical protein
VQNLGDAKRLHGFFHPFRAALAHLFPDSNHHIINRFCYNVIQLEYSKNLRNKTDTQIPKGVCKVSDDLNGKRQTPSFMMNFAALITSL